MCARSCSGAVERRRPCSSRRRNGGSRAGSAPASARRPGAARSHRSPRSSMGRAATARSGSPRRRAPIAVLRASFRTGDGRRSGIAADAEAEQLPQHARLGLQRRRRSTIAAGECRAPRRARSTGRGTAARRTPTSTSSAAIPRKATSSFVRTFAGATRDRARRAGCRSRRAPPSAGSSGGRRSASGLRHQLTLGC